MDDHRKDTVREMNAVRFDCDDDADTIPRIKVVRAIAEDMMDMDEPTCKIVRLPCRYSEIEAQP